MEKCLVLAEKGSPESKDTEVELLTAGKHFRILATMNPGGDFGKKEVKLLRHGHLYMQYAVVHLNCTVVNNSVIDYKLIKPIYNYSHYYWKSIDISIFGISFFTRDV